jgi:FeS assembly SUF system protein
MSLFSFLTGKRVVPPDANSNDDGGLQPEGGGAAGSASPSAVATVEPPRYDPLDAHPPATPFVAPDAWKTEALTAPPPEASGEKPDMGPVDPAQTAALQGKVIEALKTVYDPEIPVDIYELGLIYEILADADRKVLVKMTLTSPACPSAQQIPSEVRYKIKAIPEVTNAWVEIVWEPPWDKDRMSEAAKLSLGFL